MKYIDLFAGIGGFHLALNRFKESECVFASEINRDAVTVYQKNFDMEVAGDISLDEVVATIPENFDLLCAGFPCQPFSKGGHLKGFEDTRGTLFFNILNILERHKPKFVLLENVANLVSHDNGNTYQRIIQSLVSLGYSMPTKPLILSPHQLGIPVLRKRVFIPCVLNKNGFENMEFSESKILYGDAIDFFDFKNNGSYTISEVELEVLNLWNEFYKGINLKVIGFPIWLSELNNRPVPSSDPIWKQKIKMKNKRLYQNNKAFIEDWKLSHNCLKKFTESQRKFEWQCGEDCDSIFDGLIQFRPSGIRVKRPNLFSTQVAINHPQIIGKYLRRLTIEEAKKLQSFPLDFQMHDNNKVALKQLGNSVNVEVVYNILLKMGIFKG